MFNLVFNKNKFKLIKSNNQFVLLNWMSINVSFFSINVVGRIFRWIKNKSYMYFILPIVNKPYMFFKSNYFVFTDKLTIPLYIFKTSLNNYQIIRQLLKIRKPSIFNKRGFRILNKIFYKKKGKITTYVTNK